VLSISKEYNMYEVRPRATYFIQLVRGNNGMTFQLVRRSAMAQ
jgi:hypothetical protein